MTAPGPRWGPLRCQGCEGNCNSEAREQAETPRQEISGLERLAQSGFELPGHKQVLLEKAGPHLVSHAFFG
jgi:hypothetical protein